MHHTHIVTHKEIYDKYIYIYISISTYHTAAAQNVRPRYIPWTHRRSILMIHTFLMDMIRTLDLYLYQAASVYLLSRSGSNLLTLVRSSLVPYVRINVERSIPVLWAIAIYVHIYICVCILSVYVYMIVSFNMVRCMCTIDVYAQWTSCNSWKNSSAAMPKGLCLHSFAVQLRRLWQSSSCQTASGVEGAALHVQYIVWSLQESFLINFLGHFWSSRGFWIFGVWLQKGLPWAGTGQSFTARPYPDPDAIGHLTG